jgi:ABC-2 type transport system permease protein
VTAGALPRTPAAAAGATPVPAAGPALTRHAVRQIRRGTAVVLAVAAGMSAAVAAQYATTFAGALDRAALEALAANPAIRALFGPPVALDDPGGFTVWRTGLPVAVLVAAWALLTATRVTRGEEESGRWELLLAGRIRLPDVLLRHLGVLALAVVLVGAGVAAALVAAGTAATGAVLHGAGIAGMGLVFATVGALGAQVMPTRAAATGVSVAVLALALPLRMLAEAVPALDWLRWVSPFGLLGEVQPYAANRPLPLLPLWVMPLLLGAAALAIAGRRDLGAGLVRSTGDRPPRLALLGSLDAFALRRALRPLAGWALAIGAYYLLIGSLTGSVTAFLSDNARFGELAATAGFTGLEQAHGFVALLLSLLAVPTGLFAAARIAAAATDEVTGRAVALFSLPVSRARLASSEIAVTVGGTLLLLAVAGLGLWAGAAAAGVPLDAADALAGALNVAPVPLLSAGAAVLALGWLPRAVLGIGALPAAGGFVLLVLAQSTGAPDWVIRLSPFAHLAPVPQVAADWPATAVMTAVAVAFTLLGLAGYRRRDLRA